MVCFDIIIIGVKEVFHNNIVQTYNNIAKGVSKMQLKVKEDQSEQFLYNTPGFPVYMGQGRISDFPNYTALCHWHDDVEFSVVLSGSADYNINGEVVRVGAGEGIFINTRQLHYNFSRNRQEGEYFCILMHPMLLCASPYVERTFVAPVLDNPGFTYRVLRGPWGQNVCRMLKELYARREQPHPQLAIQACFFEIWEELYRSAPPNEKAAKPRDQNLNALKSMIAYIQKNYQKKISLESIAKAGSVSKTSCCKIFKKYVSQSPNAYLIEYRLRSGLELLRTTDMTVTEVCFEVGFSGPSYFSESFHKAFGCSPMEFRGRISRENPNKE